MEAAHTYRGYLRGAWKGRSPGGRGAGEKWVRAGVEQC